MAFLCLQVGAHPKLLVYNLFVEHISCSYNCNHEDAIFLMLIYIRTPLTENSLFWT